MQVGRYFWKQDLTDSRSLNIGLSNSIIIYFQVPSGLADIYTVLLIITTKGNIIKLIKASVTTNQRFGIAHQSHLSILIITLKLFTTCFL